jgi:probable selenium-dependent hydroxylase accessory protein YqeC
MKLIQALNLLPGSKGRMISFVGGGGKTSTLFALADELAEAGKKVLITTTTAMYNPEGVNHPGISILGEHVTVEGKLKGISTEMADKIYQRDCYDFILVEADGSKGRPIKAPAEHEPVIPRSTDLLVGVIGMDSFGKALSSEYVHRPELLAERAEAELGDIVNEEVITALVAHKLGLFKSCPKEAVKILLLNKVLEEETKEAARKIGNQVLNTCTDINRVLLAAVKEQEPVKELLQR